jgi:hypothetical protein
MASDYTRSDPKMEESIGTPVYYKTGRYGLFERVVAPFENPRNWIHFLGLGEKADGRPWASE